MGTESQGHSQSSQSKPPTTKSEQPPATGKLSVMPRSIAPSALAEGLDDGWGDETSESQGQATGAISPELSRAALAPAKVPDIEIVAPPATAVGGIGAPRASSMLSPTRASTSPSASSAGASVAPKTSVVPSANASAKTSVAPKTSVVPAAKATSVSKTPTTRLDKTSSLPPRPLSTYSSAPPPVADENDWDAPSASVASHSEAPPMARPSAPAIERDAPHSGAQSSRIPSTKDGTKDRASAPPAAQRQSSAASARTTLIGIEPPVPVTRSSVPPGAAAQAPVTASPLPTSPVLVLTDPQVSRHTLPEFTNDVAAVTAPASLVSREEGGSSAAEDSFTQPPSSSNHPPEGAHLGAEREPSEDSDPLQQNPCRCRERPADCGERARPSRRRCDRDDQFGQPSDVRGCFRRGARVGTRSGRKRRKRSRADGGTGRARDVADGGTGCAQGPHSRDLRGPNLNGPRGGGRFPPSKPKSRLWMYVAAAALVVGAIWGVAGAKRARVAQRPDRGVVAVQPAHQGAENAVVPLGQASVSPAVAEMSAAPEGAPAPTHEPERPAAEPTTSASPDTSAQAVDAAEPEVTKVRLEVVPTDSKVALYGKVVEGPLVFDVKKGTRTILEIARPGYVTRRIVLNGKKTFMRIMMTPLPKPESDASNGVTSGSASGPTTTP
ncbi:MAG: hypothetical protein QM784_15190 [Polyangiaceae bacterium]